jgi:hypothetical protein
VFFSRNHVSTVSNTAAAVTNKKIPLVQS